MPNQREKYAVAGVDLFSVRNRNETRVAASLREALDDLGTHIPSHLIQDAYALALNHLPARYAQRGTIVLRDPVKKAEIRKAVERALRQVIGNPK